MSGEVEVARMNLCNCGRPDCTATVAPPVWHRPRLDVNDYGTPVTVHVCKACGHEFTVCPANPEFGDECLGETCGSYDLGRDVDIFFEAALDAGWIIRHG